MRKLTALALAFAFAGITFAQQAQSGSSQGQYPIGGGKQYKEWWCSQNWEKCKQMKLEDLSAKKSAWKRAKAMRLTKNVSFCVNMGIVLDNKEDRR